MERKRWTPKTDVDESVRSIREKRKWQIALRRYVLEGNKSSAYAPYFGLDIQKFRQWIEAQFDQDLHWENFSSAWQFDHVVPVAYFDFGVDADLRLCWNFTNIRIEKLLGSKTRRHGVDVLAAKRYFEVLYQQTGYAICQAMLQKINSIEAIEIAGNAALALFINEHSDYLSAVQDFGSDDFVRLNTGTALKTIRFEKDFLKRLGADH